MSPTILIVFRDSCALPPHYPLLVAVLRRTLDEIEGEPDMHNDAAPLQLKSTLLRILARIEIPDAKNQPPA